MSISFTQSIVAHSALNRLADDVAKRASSATTDIGAAAKVATKANVVAAGGVAAATDCAVAKALVCAVKIDDDKTLGCVAQLSFGVRLAWFALTLFSFGLWHFLVVNRQSRDVSDKLIGAGGDSIDADGLKRILGEELGEKLANSSYVRSCTVATSLSGAVDDFAGKFNAAFTVAKSTEAEVEKQTTFQKPIELLAYATHLAQNASYHYLMAFAGAMSGTSDVYELMDVLNRYVIDGGQAFLIAESAPAELATFEDLRAALVAFVRLTAAAMGIAETLDPKALRQEAAKNVFYDSSAWREFESAAERANDECDANAAVKAAIDGQNVFGEEKGDEATAFNACFGKLVAALGRGGPIEGAIASADGSAIADGDALRDAIKSEIDHKIFWRALVVSVVYYYKMFLIGDPYKKQDFAASLAEEDGGCLVRLLGLRFFGAASSDGMERDAASRAIADAIRPLIVELADVIAAAKFSVDGADVTVEDLIAKEETALKTKAETAILNARDVFIAAAREVATSSASAEDAE
ncbi:MAG: hypothetical protein LBI39_02385 [Puniceicoccales bacterium]|nr:hypothetical protein [Puniceicoccales bacterium]